MPFWQRVATFMLRHRMIIIAVAIVWLASVGLLTGFFESVIQQATALLIRIIDSLLAALTSVVGSLLSIWIVYKAIMILFKRSK